ncbi:MAG: hypothetical protein ACXIVG_04910 [Pararhodobacter sp.]
MKRLLATTAITASMAFAGAASAQSLLESILDEVVDVQLGMLNAAENLADLDASINIDNVADLSDLIAALTSTISTEVASDTFDIDGFLRGVSQTGTTVAVDFFEPAPTVSALQTSIGDLNTTLIGALNTGVIGGNGGEDGTISQNVMHLVNATEESVAQTAGSLAASATFSEFGGMQFANLALNDAADLNASVNITQLLANIDGVSTTLIGALNTGDIATDINTNASGITAAIVGN